MLTSISKVGSQLYSGKNREKFVEVCLLNLSANRTPSIILGQPHGMTTDFFDAPVLSFPFAEDDTPKL